MGDLVLKTRVSVARRNLRRILQLSKTVEMRLASLGELFNLPETLRSEIDEAWEKSHNLESLARPFEEDAPHLMLEARSLNEQLDKISKTLRERSRTAKLLRDELVQLFSQRKDVDDFLLKSARQLEPTLTVTNYLLYQGRIEALFSEYVDLLRGVALRSAGFGDHDGQLSELFLIADQLPSLWGRVEGWTWQSLAVPSRKEGTSSSEAMVLRVGFPEWTVWALPFVQHEFGHVFAKKRQFAGSSPPEGFSAAALADALATVVTGPAYACAALLLRLNPADVAPAAEATARSATILVTLRRIAAARPASPVGTLTQRLCGEWRDAVTAANGDVNAFDSAMEAQLTSDVADWARRELLGADQPLWLQRWATVTTWAQHLQDGHHQRIELAEAAADDDDRPMALAFILDAAWLARVGTTASEDAPAENEDVIAEGAIGKMLEVVRPPGRPPGTGGTGQNRKRNQ